MRPPCSPKDKIWSQTDKLQRCRRLPLEQAKLRQILVAESLCYRLRCTTFSFRNNINPGADDQFFPYEYPQYPPGWIHPLPGPYMFDDRGNPSPSRPRVLTRCQNPFSSEKIAQCRHQPQSSSRRASSSVENKKAQDRYSKEEEKLLVQLWAEKHDQLESRESQSANSMVLCFVHRFCS